MNDCLQNVDEIEYTKENAKVEFKKGNFAISEKILERLWNDSPKTDAYLLYDYGKALRKVKASYKFVEICRELNGNNNIISNTWIVSTLCWCLYECYIKDYAAEDNDNFNDFIKRSEYIKDHCVQLSANEHYKNPYILTVKKVVKIYNVKASKNYKKIIEWLSYLDPDRLSEEVFSFQDETGKDRELASSKEFYYQHKAKALEKTGEFHECIITCETALNQIEKFHYRNNTWLRARMYYSKCMVAEDIEGAIAEYKGLAYKENYWFMYHKLSQICFRYNKIQDALLYASKAYQDKFEYEKMVNLMLDTALLWQAVGNKDNAKHFFQASAYYRERQAWSSPEELRYAISEFEIDTQLKPNIRLLQKISNDYVYSVEGNSGKLEGEIISILSHGGSGFIKPEDNSNNVYFNMKDVLGKKILKVGNQIEYELSNGKEGKMRAVNIKVKE